MADAFRHGMNAATGEQRLLGSVSESLASLPAARTASSNPIGELRGPSSTSHRVPAANVAGLCNHLCLGPTEAGIIRRTASLSLRLRHCHMRSSRTLQLSLVLAGALCVASGGCGKSGTAAVRHDGAARPDTPAGSGGVPGGSGGSAGIESSAGMGSGGAITSGGVAGTAPGGTGGSGGSATAAAGGAQSGGAGAIVSGGADAAASGGAGATASGGASATAGGGSDGSASGGVGGTATGGSGGTKTVGSVGVGGTVTAGVGGIGSGGSGGTLTGMGGSAKGGSTGSGGTSPEPIADGGIDSDAPDPLGAALSEKTLTYWATSEQRRPDGGGMLSRNPSDQDFAAITPVAEDVLVFSTDATTVRMTAIPPDGGVPLGVPRTGTRTATDQGKWSYQLAPATGGRLVVWLSGTTILASKTLYGSGVPVTESTRGELRSD